MSYFKALWDLSGAANLPSLKICAESCYISQMHSKSVFIFTYGCQMNVHDSEKLLGVLSETGYTAAESPEKADLIVFNTCAIRDKAEQKFYSQLGRTKLLKLSRPGLKIAVAGCVAQEVRGRLLRRAPFVDFVLGPQNIHLIGSMVSGERNTAFEDNPQIGSLDFDACRSSTFKAWVSIMFGCNNFCSYCIVPYTRGREVSRPAESIISEIRDLGRKGYKEITLLGQNVNSYKSNIDFPGLLERVDGLGIPRVRFVTSHPRDLSPRLVRAIADLPNVCEHLHLPLQAGSDHVLQKMNRGYTIRNYLEKIDALRNSVPGIAITTDIIAGFPGETDGDFDDTLRALEEIEFDGIFAFKYSPRSGTRAYEMEGQISEEMKSERLSRILELQEGITYRKNKRLESTVQEILVEGPSETDPYVLAGRTRTNKIVTLSSTAPAGSFISVRIARARLHSLDADQSLENIEAMK